MTWLRANWSGLLARLPLPMLALAAAYGVWSFQALFVPWYVAAVSAASFELVYIGIAVTRLGAEQRKRAMAISIGAVVVSIIYNSLSALFAIRPALLLGRPLWADIALAIIHGLPLAIVAYLVADLLLHTPRVASRVLASESKPLAVESKTPAPPLSKTETVKRLASTLGVSESTVWRKLERGELSLNGTKES
jgi:hypothetical protein